ALLCNQCDDQCKNCWCQQPTFKQAHAVVETAGCLAKVVHRPQSCADAGALCECSVTQNLACACQLSQCDAGTQLDHALFGCRRQAICRADDLHGTDIPADDAADIARRNLQQIIGKVLLWLNACQQPGLSA